MDKINEYFTFRSVFSTHIKDFLFEKERKDLLRGLMLKCFMLEFDRFFIEYNITNLNITKELILEWKATRINDNTRNLYHKYIAWIHFCRYLCSIGIECYVPNTPKEGRQNDYIPYIYTHEEIMLIFSSADQLRIEKHRNDTPIVCFTSLSASTL